MKNFSDLARTRRSIRKYENQDIPMEDIEYFINAAVSAPSGCNSQCWNFVVVKNAQMIAQMKDVVIDKIQNLLKVKQNQLSESYLTSKEKMAGFFSKAPIVIAVFMTDVGYFDEVFISALKEQGYSHGDIMDLFGNYDLLSIGAAVQNLLLAVHEKGYGACWMNEPVIAGKEVNKILKVPLEQRFISLIPIGIPAYTPREKPMKDFDKICTIID